MERLDHGLKQAEPLTKKNKKKKKKYSNIPKIRFITSFKMCHKSIKYYYFSKIVLFEI